MNITAEIYDFIQSNTAAKEFQKKHTFLRQGEISKSAYYVESGCLRLWYNNDGDDVSVKFFLAGDIVASLDSFYLEEPSKFSLETITPSIVRTVEKKGFQRLYDDSALFRNQMLSISISCMRDYQDFFLSRIMNNPERRYRQLVEQNPKLFDIVPQHYLAS